MSRLPTGDAFKGMLPKLDDDKLPAMFSAMAVNCRFKSGGLTSWKSPLISPGKPIVKGGTIRSLWLMDVDESDGGYYPLHFAPQVEFARTPHSTSSGGDVEERTAFTHPGIGPRITTKPLATDEPPPGGVAVGEYPYISWPLGVFRPTGAPTVVVDPNAPEPDEIVLENPGAEETPPTDGWINVGGFVLGSFQTGDTTLPPFLGNRYFSGSGDFGAGLVQDGEAYYPYPDISALNLVPGQSLRLVWQQARGAFSSKASVGIEFLDNLASPISRRDAELRTSVSVADTDWEEREFADIVIPEGTVAMRIYQKYEGDGINPTDAYIDEIELFGANASLTFDGQDLASFQVDTVGDTTVTENDTAGFPSPAFLFTSRKDRIGAISIDVNADEQASMAVRWTYNTDGSDDVSMTGVMMAGPAGDGYGISMFESGLWLTQSASWTAQPTKIKQLTTVGYSSTLPVKIGLAITRLSATKASMGYEVYRADTFTLTPIAQGTEEIPIKGGLIGWKASDGGSNFGEGRLSDIVINLQPRDVGNEEDQTQFADYVFTYVDSLGRQSAPSPASDPDSPIYDNSTRTVTTPTAPIAGYDIVSKRIYRLATTDTGSFYFRLAEIPLAQADYVDTTEDDGLGPVLETANTDFSDAWDEPLFDMHSILSGPRFMIGFSKNQACFSVYDQAHAWPVLWRRNTDYYVVGGAIIDNDVYVLTQDRPYIAQAIDPSNMDLQKLSNENGCVSKRSIAVLKKRGVLYATAIGLAFATRAEVLLLTAEMFDEENWKMLNPSSIAGFVYDGLYFGFYDSEGQTFEYKGQTFEGKKGGFVIDPNNKSDGVVWLDAFATAGFVDPITGKLYLVIGGVLVIWNEGATLLVHRLRSRRFLMPTTRSWGAAYVDLGTREDEVFRLIYDDVEVQEMDDLTFEFPLTDVRAERSVQFELEGTDWVRRPPAIADTMKELT